jgi:hypothetical protein
MMPCGTDWMRWPYHGLPRGTVVGPTCQVACARVGPTWVMWSNRGLTHGMLELMWLHTVLPCVSWGPTLCWCGLLRLCHVVWPSELALCGCAVWHKLEWGGPLVDCHMAQVGPTCQTCGTHMGEVDQWGADTWHWHAEVAQWGADTCHSLSLPWFYVCMFEILSLHPVVYLSPSCTQMNPWLNLSPWSAYLICFMFSEFILIAPLIQKLWNFHKKSLNSWWSPL